MGEIREMQKGDREQGKAKGYKVPAINLSGKVGVSKWNYLLGYLIYKTHTMLHVCIHAFSP